ncbi:MAG: lysylphosphatidylglycerol synthase transmembrane domain-containing protein [Fibrobacterota bacterium]
MSNTHSSLRRWLSEAAKIAIGVGLLAFLWHKGLIDPVQLGNALTDHPLWMLAAIGFHGILFLSLAMRWKLVLAANHIPIANELVTRLTMVSHFFSTCLPGNGAGDLIKGWIFSKRGTEFGVVLGTMALDRILGMAGLFLTWSIYLVVATITKPQSRGLLLPFLGVALTLGLGLLVMVAFSRKIDRFLQAMKDPNPGIQHRILHLLRKIVGPVAKGSTSSSTIVSALAISFVIQSSYIATAWVAGIVLSIPVGIVAAGAVLPLVSLVNAIPLSPGGVGLGESVGAAAMREFGMAQNAGAQIVLVMRIASVFWALVGMACYITLKPKRTGQDSSVER